MLTLEYLSQLLDENREAARATVREFAIGHKPFSFNSAPALMGVINLSPESWYRESVCLSADKAVARAQLLVAQGADIIDVGAESTLAQAARVDDAMQQSKLLPVVTALRQQSILVSVETYHPSVTKACLQAGANILNLTGVAGGPEIYRVVAEHDAALILCFVQGPNVREVGELLFEGDFVSVLYEFFARELDSATRAGVQKIFIDPGMGFYYRNLQDSAKRVQHQMRTFLATFKLRTLGFPICHALPHAFEYFGEEVRCAEPFFAVLAALGKTDLFRTHEVSRTKAVLDTLKVF
ncbi:MAG TPA: dihydropteroate synthase [Candidatus Saccharimonadales bacterium]|nr:dihydropteroate synthase [Candidatus Saccharimonadales bacterium]